MLKFKIEIFLLLISITLFTVSAFFFSYASGVNLTYPLRNFALTFVGSGSALMTVASISYSKRSKTCA
ncbi:MAG TPA: hypothetical protein VMD05_09800 [Candidatus Nanoarchaeia archaeon]|nr:hypothetical protein [Candidatus Nanoarchaeia archaeon]